MRPLIAAVTALSLLLSGCSTFAVDLPPLIPPSQAGGGPVMVAAAAIRGSIADAREVFELEPAAAVA